MRRYSLLLALALCLCLAAGCGAEDVIHDIAGSLQQATAAPLPTLEPETGDQAEGSFATLEPAVSEASDGDLTVAYDDASGTDAQAPAGGGDFTALPAEDCVEDLAPYEGAVPYIKLDCAGADAINEELAASFVPMADDPMCEDMYYQCAKGAGRVLSVVMTVKGPNDTIFYTPFNLDLATGQELSGPELLALLGVDENELRNLEQAIIGQEFTHQFGTAEGQTDPDFYQQQYDRTTSPDNTETERLWFSGDGQLCFAGRVYGMAGAEYYECSLGTGLVF